MTAQQIAREVAQTHPIQSVRTRAALIELALAGGNTIDPVVEDQLRRLHAGEPLESVVNG